MNKTKITKPKLKHSIGTPRLHISDSEKTKTLGIIWLRVCLVRLVN